MYEIPRDSDLLWQAAMNSAPIERHPDTLGKSVLHSSIASEPVFGYHPRESTPLDTGSLAQAADLVDNVFTEQIYPDTTHL